MELHEFLLARIAEDEAANKAGPEPEAWCDRGEGLHLNHPRVLAECEAKRRIVEAYREERARRDIYQSDQARNNEDDEQATRRRSSAARCRGLEMAVELLALPYADHEAFDEAWRP